MGFDFNENIVLENDRVLLRPLTVMDFENLKAEWDGLKNTVFKGFRKKY